MEFKDKFFDRFSSAKERRQNWDNTYQDAMEYAAPQRNNFTRQEKGTRKDRPDIVFDSTAVNGIQKFVSNLQAGLVPPMKKWSSLQTGAGIPKDQRDRLNSLLEELTEVMFAAIHASNFDVQVSEAFIDLAFGTGALLVQPGTANTPLVFTAIPLHELYLEEGANGRVETVFREHSVTYQNVKATWPDAKLPDDYSDFIENSPNKEARFVEGTIADEVEVRKEGKKVTVNGYRYIVMDVKTKNILVDRSMTYSPWVVFRWSVMPGETYGRGPVLYALADVKTLNKSIELELKSASLDAAPPMMVRNDGFMNLENIQIEPRAIIPVDWDMNGPGIQPLLSGARPDLSRLVIQDLRRNINEMLFTDPLGPVDLPVKTATEISIRQQEFANRSGAAFGRLHHELVVPLIETVLNVLEQVIMPDGAPLIDLADFKVNGMDIDIRHISPLATAQDQEQLTSMMRYAEHMMQLVGPEMLHTVMKVDEYARKAADNLNLPKELIPTKEESDQIQQNLIQLAEQQVQQA